MMDTAATEPTHWAMTWENVHQAIDNLVRQIKGDDLEIVTILAIAKGGLIPASLLWQHFPHAHFGVLRVSSYHGLGKLPPKVEWPGQAAMYEWNARGTLVIDDICDSGDTFKLLQSHLTNPLYAAMLIRDKPEIEEIVHYWGAPAPSNSWVDFPWERKHKETGAISLT